MNLQLLQLTCFSFVPLSPGTIAAINLMYAYLGGIGGVKNYSACIHNFGSHFDLGDQVCITI